MQLTDTTLSPPLQTSGYYNIDNIVVSQSVIMHTFGRYMTYMTYVHHT